METDEITAKAIAEAFNHGRGATSTYCPEDQVADLQRLLRALGIEAVRSTYQTTIAHGVLLVLSRVDSTDGVIGQGIAAQEQRAMALQEQTV